MARILGVDLPGEKRVEVGLTHIYDIGFSTSYKILVKIGVNPDIGVKDLTKEEVAKIRGYVKTLTIEGDLRGEVALGTKRLIEIGCYRGTGHRKGLPVRGQKIKINARTRESPKETIANKKK